jgi:hypothetical protein
MSALDLAALAALALALLPLALAARNLSIYRPPRERAAPGTRVSVLIPARDEEASIGVVLDALLASVEVDLEIIVLDDQSTDGTAGIVQDRAARDDRVRLLHAPPLPDGWAGKQRACALLASHAQHEVLMFLDADVVVTPDAVSLAAGALLREPQLGLVSGFPRERTGTLAEHLAVPWIHILLLGYLPMDRMRSTRDPAFGAGCGQCMVARRTAYEAVGGHAATRASLHDGTSLPRSFRARGWGTDLFDATSLAQVRMYSGLAQVWRGFGKSAGEGMATPMGLPIWTLLIGGGHVLPWLLLPLALSVGASFAAAACGAAVLANVLLRVLLARRFRQHATGVLLHPLSSLFMLAIQWWSLTRYLAGRPNRWRGRAYRRIAALQDSRHSNTPASES